MNQSEDCKRQVAILFSFLEEDQPTELMERLLGQLDNGQVSSLIITDPGGGYTGNIPKVLPYHGTIYSTSINYGISFCACKVNSIISGS